MVSQIKMARILKGLTQKQLANKIASDVGAISRMENKRPVFRSTFIRVCEVLGIDPSTINDVVITDRSGTSVGR